MVLVTVVIALVVAKAVMVRKKGDIICSGDCTCTGGIDDGYGSKVMALVAVVALFVDGDDGGNFVGHYISHLASVYPHLLILPMKET